jgi:hypothetical protein
MRLAQLAVFAATSVERGMRNLRVAGGLARNACPNTRKDFAPSLRDGRAAVVAKLGGCASGKMCPGTQNSVFDRIVNLVLYSAIACPTAGHMLFPSTLKGRIFLAVSER